MPLIKEDLVSAKQKPAESQIPKEKSLVHTIGSLLPFAPLVYEQFTGQKIPPLTGTLAEMNSALSSLQLSLSQVLQNQQQLWNRLEALEKNASSQLTNLGQQFQSLRLTHTRETKSIDYNQPQLETED